MANKELLLLLNMSGMWKPMVFLAIAAVALYVLPNMRPQDTESWAS